MKSDRSHGETSWLPQRIKRRRRYMLHERERSRSGSDRNEWLLQYFYICIKRADIRSISEGELLVLSRNLFFLPLELTHPFICCYQVLSHLSWLSMNESIKKMMENKQETLAVNCYDCCWDQRTEECDARVANHLSWQWIIVISWQVWIVEKGMTDCCHRRKVK